MTYSTVNSLTLTLVIQKKQSSRGYLDLENCLEEFGRLEKEAVLTP